MRSFVPLKTEEPAAQTAGLFVSNFQMRCGSSRVHKTKSGIWEHRASAFVVGAGNEKTREENFP
jgi:hypothetical protein